MSDSQKQDWLDRARAPSTLKAKDRLLLAAAATAVLVLVGSLVYGIAWSVL